MPWAIYLTSFGLFFATDAAKPVNFGFVVDQDTYSIPGMMAIVNRDLKHEIHSTAQ